MTDLAQIIKDSVTETMTAEAIREKVDKQVNSLVDEAIKDQLRSYGDIGKMIKEKVAESLQVTDLNLPSYSTMITQMLRTQIEETVHPLIAGKLAEDFEELLKLAPKTIKLSEIVEQMMKDSSAYQDGEYGDLVTCIIGDSSYSSTWIYLDGDEHYDESDKYRCDVHILVSENGTIFSGSVHGRDLTGKGKSTGASFGRSYGLAERIQAYYVCGTVIEIDADNVSTYRDYD